jgi:hypothetical protein
VAAAVLLPRRRSKRGSEGGVDVVAAAAAVSLRGARLVCSSVRRFPPCLVLEQGPVNGD